MEKKKHNCKNCIRFATCKFVEENKIFATSNKMYGMFEYLEQNNLQEIFYSNAGSCNFFVFSDMDADAINKKIEGAIYGFVWLKNYINSFNAENTEHHKIHAMRASETYISKLKQ